MNFTKDQEKAYQFSSSDCLVSAGAGSGKTQVLSERVRYLIEEKGYHIEDFLILTFTKLAANEMKARIKKKLLSINKEEAMKVDNAYISTFDSFSYAVVKKYHYLLNMENEINIIDSNVLEIFLKLEIEHMFASLYQTDETFKKMVEVFCYRDDKTLSSLVLKILKKADACDDEEAFYDNFLDSFSKETILARIKNYSDLLDEKISDLLALASETGDEKYALSMQKSLNQYFSSSTLDEKVASINFRLPSSNNVEDKKLIEQIKALKNEIMVMLKNYQLEEDVHRENNDNRVFAAFLVKTCKELKRRLEEYKNKQHLYSFSDIAKKGITLLKTHPEIASELKNSFKTIMIDEYQDTSSLQENFIALISNNNVYQVGDVKQSIYRFRNATPEIFIDKFARYSNHIGGELISLSDNFRSRDEVLKDINHLFEKIMTLEMGGANYLKDHHINTGNQDYANYKYSDFSYHSLIISYDQEKYQSRHLKKSEIEASLICEDIISKINSGFEVMEYVNNKPILRKAKLSDFCILADRGTEFVTFQKVFASYQIPLFMESNENIIDNHLIMVFSSLLKMIKCLFENDCSSNVFKHAYLSLGRSYLFSLSDEVLFNSLKNNDYHLVTDKINSIVKHGYLSFYELIIALVEKLGFYSKLVNLGDITASEKYLDYFLSLIKSLCENGYTLDEFITYFDKIREYELKLEVPSSSTSFEAVKIMNIFKSKGLEFPIVYCVGLSSKFNDVDAKETFYISSNGMASFPKHDLSKSYLGDELMKKDKLADRSEKIRLLYVELTRAKEKLYFLLPKKLLEKEYIIGQFNCLGSLLLADKDYFQIEEKEIKGGMFNRKNVFISQKSIHLDKIDINRTKVDDVRASKQLSFSSDDKLLNLGEKLHFYLELIDFTNPDFNLIETEYRGYIEKFLSSYIIKNLKNPHFYKEYQFSDEIAPGVIDLLIVDNDNCFIIDYKLKHLDDAAYLKQLKVYHDYILRVFNKDSRCYLYSLIDGYYKKIDWS